MGKINMKKILMKKINGYIAAPFTPMLENGDVNLNLIPEYADMLIRAGLDGVFINGSTGEGALLTKDERMSTAKKWIEVSAGRLKVIVHTGGTNIREQQELAVHAEKNGAWAVAAMAPAFLAPKRSEELVEYCKAIASSAPSIPFYFYYIPSLNGFRTSLVDFLTAADGVIPNLAGVKFTDNDIFEFEKCRYVAESKYEMLWGYDEMFLDALAYGNISGVGGTYNHCFSLYMDMKAAYENKDMNRCRLLQHQSHQFCDILGKYRGNIMAGKRMMKFLGLDMGPNRTPLQTISEEEEAVIKKKLEAIGFFNYCNR